MNVIIATGKKEIDMMIKEVTGGTLSPVAYREGVLLQYRKNGAELAFLSPLLPGSMPFEQLLYELRKDGVRIVALVGHTSPKEIREKWLPLSVYDLILDPVTEEKIRMAIESPATLGMAEEKILLLEKGETEEPEVKGWGKWFRKRETPKEAVEQKEILQKNKPIVTEPVDNKIDVQTDTQEKPSALRWLFRKRHEVTTADEPLNPVNEKTKPIENKPEPKPTPYPIPPSPVEQPKTMKPVNENKADNSHEFKPKHSVQSAPSNDPQSIPDLVKLKQELIFFAQEPSDVQTEKRDSIKREEERKESNSKANETVHGQSRIRTPSQEWNAVLGLGDEELPEPEGYTILVTSPTATGKTYVALNLAATLSKQGALTKLVSFRSESALWTYLNLPVGKHGLIESYPNLHVETFERMSPNGHYRVIDLPFDRWDKVLHWDNVLVVYVEDMDIHHQKLCEKHVDTWQGKRLLKVLNRFVPNVLESGLEQRLRVNADLVLSDLPMNLVAMRYGQPVIQIDQTAAREFEFAAKTILAVLPRRIENIRSIG